MTDAIVMSARKSGATRQEISGVIDQSLSGATTSEVEGAVIRQQRTLIASASQRSYFLGAVAIATMLPFREIDDVLFSRRKFVAETVRSYVIYWDEEADDFTRSPSIIAVVPERGTLVFPSDRPLPILPPRLPFVSRSSLSAEQE